MAPGGQDPARPRVLIPLTTSFAVRYVVRTRISQLVGGYCHPVLGLTWDDPALEADLRAEGAEVIRIPDAQLSHEIQTALVLERHVYEDRLKSSSTKIDWARTISQLPPRRRTRRRLAAARDRFRARRLGAAAIERLIAEGLSEGTNLDENIELLRVHEIDAVLSVTPYVPQEFLILHAARRLGLTSVTSIISFDNLSTRPPLPIPFSRYLVWNSFMVDELLRSDPRSSADQVAVVGAGQFDFYEDDAYQQDEATWAERLGIDPGLPTVLFGGGPTSIAPNETQYLDDLLQGVADGRLPADLRIILRRHPIDDPQRWERFRSHPSVAFDDPGATGTVSRRLFEVNLRAEQIVALRSALTHTDVHVNVSSTMTLDGAYFDKPQIGPAYDRIGGRREGRDVRDLYAREHFVPIMASKGLELAASPTQLVELVARALDDPARLTAERRKMVEAMCTFTDGRTAERIADELRPILSTAAAPSTASATT